MSLWRQWAKFKRYLILHISTREHFIHFEPLQTYLESSLLEMKRWFRIDEVELWWDLILLENHDGLDSASHTAGCFQVSNVGLDAANRQFGSSSCFAAKYSADGRYLCSVTRYSPRSVTLYKQRVHGIKAGSAVDRTSQCFLRVGVGQENT